MSICLLQRKISPKYILKANFEIVLNLRHIYASMYLQFQLQSSTYEHLTYYYFLNMVTQLVDYLVFGATYEKCLISNT